MDLREPISEKTPFNFGFLEDYPPISTRLDQLNGSILSYLSCETETADKLIRHLFLGGKRIRPKLFLLVADLVEYDGPHLLPMAAVVEYIHAASLLHDDVVDNSTLRRGRPTANSIWGDESAVLVGDFIYSTASRLMAKTQRPEIVDSFATAIQSMSEGELLQLENRYNFKLSEKIYLRIVKCKTAVLISAACRVAGILSNCSAEKIEALGEMGLNVGMAFQLIDDALDYTGETHLLGKKANSDLKSGLTTLPFIFLREKDLRLEEREALATLDPDLTEEKLAYIFGLVDQYGTVSEALARASAHTEKALATLEQYFGASQARTQLEQVFASLLVRKH